MRCRRCGLVYSNPQPVPRSIDQHYEVDPDCYWPEEGDRDFTSQIATFDRLYLGSKRVALDIGAGTGENLVALQAAGFSAQGIEPSRPFYERAFERGVNVAQVRIEQAQFHPETFSLVSFASVLEHLCDPAEAIATALKWCEPQGLIHAEVPSARWLTSRLINAAYRLQGLDYVTNLSPMHPPYHLYEFTLESFRAHSANHGYAVIDHTIYEGTKTYLPIPGLQTVMRHTGMGMELEVWLRKLR